MRRRYGCLLIALCLFAVALCAGYRYGGAMVERRIETEVASRIPRVIGVSASYQVDASAGLAGVARGRIDSVRIRGTNVRLKSGISLSRFDTTLKGIHVDPVKRAPTRIESAEFNVSVTGAELNSFLAKRYPEIPSRAELRDGFVRVAAEPRIKGTRVRVEADAVLEIESGTRLVLRVRRVASGPLAACEVAQRYVERRLNPVLDLTSLGIKGKLTSVNIRPGAVDLSGEGEPGALSKL